LLKQRWYFTFKSLQTGFLYYYRCWDKFDRFVKFKVNFVENIHVANENVSVDLFFSSIELAYNISLEIKE
jgi:hypothetical protein